MAAIEAYYVINSGKSALNVGPGFRSVVCDGEVSMLEACNGDCS
jgi:hypothetical protein